MVGSSLAARGPLRAEQCAGCGLCEGGGGEVNL